MIDDEAVAKLGRNAGPRRCMQCKEVLPTAPQAFLFCSSDCEEQWAYYQGGVGGSFTDYPDKVVTTWGNDGERPMKGDDI